MAVTKEDIKTTFPIPSYNYRVDIDGEAVAFSEISGLSISYETSTYKESPVESGKPGPRVMVMPGQAQSPTITMKKGVVPAVSIKVLYNWIKGIQTNQVDKKDINISLCNENGDAVVTWKVSNAFPTKLDAPSFTADSNDVAVESMELTADGISISEA